MSTVDDVIDVLNDIVGTRRWCYGRLQMMLRVPVDDVMDDVDDVISAVDDVMSAVNDMMGARR